MIAIDGEIDFWMIDDLDEVVIAENIDRGSFSINDMMVIATCYIHFIKYETTALFLNFYEIIEK